MDGYCSDTTRCVFTGEVPAEIAEAYAVLHEAQAASVAVGRRRHAVRGRRPGGPRHHRRGRLGRAVHPPHRPRHRHGGARGPLHRRRQPPPAGARPRVQRRARDLRRRSLGDAARGHRRRHRRPVPTPLNASDHRLVPVDACRTRVRASAERRFLGRRRPRRQLDVDVGRVEAGERAAVERAVRLGGVGQRDLPRTSRRARRSSPWSPPPRRSGRAASRRRRIAALVA